VPEVRAAFEEQVAWAAEAGAEMIIAETFSWLGEALLALEVIRAAGLPAVVTFAVHRDGTLRDVDSPEDACRQAEQAGATVVGLNCIRGPRTMLGRAAIEHCGPKHPLSGGFRPTMTGGARGADTGSDSFNLGGGPRRIARHTCFQGRV
jgi:S-methylmethionine-dependent homocysteine/selenocysteine methylase